MVRREHVFAVCLILSATLVGLPDDLTAQAQEQPYVRDRGTGVATSMFGTYVSRGELLFYPFFEWYLDRNFEYKPNAFGHVGESDFRGRYTASEGLIFLAYGLGENLAIEVEAGMISAELRKSPKDRSGMPAVFKESGLGDVEGQIRWRFRQETARRAEMFTYFETVLPLQKNKRLIGTPAWEYKLGFGMTRGRSNGTWSFRTGIEWDDEDKKFEVGEYAFEYLRRLSAKWKIFAMIEGNQIDEVALVSEVQWHVHPRAYVKIGTGIGLTPNATDFAPEIGGMFRF
ncbi:MAG: hypothetical protein ACT4P6_12170 [Gemmatimonadaceae bacterium]